MKWLEIAVVQNTDMSSLELWRLSLMNWNISTHQTDMLKAFGKNMQDGIGIEVEKK